MEQNQPRFDFDNKKANREQKKKTTEVEKTIDSDTFAFGRVNFIMIGVSMLIVVVGFIMMAGEGSTPEKFNPEIFNSMRISVAPIVTLFGYLSIIIGIMYKPKAK